MTTRAARTGEHAPARTYAAQAPGVPRLANACASLLMFAALVDSQVVAAVAPQVAAGLGVAKTSAAASITVYSLAAASVALLLSRRRGRITRPAAWLPVAAGLFVAANLMAALAPGVAIFWAGRAVAGLAGGLVSALVIAALADASSYARRGRQMSGVAVSYFLAPVVGVPAGTWLAGLAGWRMVFFSTAALVTVAGLLVRRFPLAPPRVTEAGSDAADSIPSAAEAEQERAVRDEGALARASLWKLITRTRSRRRGIASAFFVSGGLVCLTAYLATWLSDAFQASAGEVAIVYALAGAGAVIGGAAGGALADRFGKRRVAVAASLWTTLFVLLIPTFNRGALLVASIGAAALAAALRVAPLQALITELVEPVERATYVAARNASSQLGIALAVIAGGRAYQRYGMTGVALLSAALTIGAWLTLRKIADPHARGELEGEPEGEMDQRATSRRTRDGGAGSLVARDARRRGRRIARGLVKVAFVVALLVFFGLPWLLSFAITKAGTRPDERARTDTPAAHGAQFEEVTFTAGDGVRLSGWYLPSRTHRLTVVMTHGLFRSRYEMLGRGLRLWQQGYGVLLYDLRRHGRSAGEFSSVGYFERRDVEAALKFTEMREPQNRIVLFGVSMGAAATLLAAAETQHDERLAGVVAESSFLSFSDTARHHVGLTPLPTSPFAPLLIKFTGWRLGFAPESFDVLSAVRKLRVPLLFIGSGADRRMPNETVLEPLYDAAPSLLKRKIVVPGATHGHAYDVAPDAYMNALDQFLQTVAPDDPAAIR